MAKLLKKGKGKGKMAKNNESTKTSPSRRIDVAISKTIQVDQYEPIRLHFGMSETIKDDEEYKEVIEKRYEELLEILEEKMEEYVEKHATVTEVNDLEEESSEPEEEPGESEEEPSEPEEEVITENDILEMSKKELIQLIEEEGLDIDYKGVKVKDLRQAVIDEVFGDDNWGED